VDLVHLARITVYHCETNSRTLPGPDQLLHYTISFGSFLSSPFPRSSVPVALFPVFYYGDVLYSFSPNFLDTAPLLYVKVLDAYYHCIFSLKENWPYSDFSSYLYSSYKLNDFSPENPLSRLIRSLSLMLFHRLDWIMRMRGRKQQLPFDERLSREFEVERSWLFEDIFFEQHFCAKRHGETFLALCVTYSVVPRFTREHYGLEELIALAIEFLPDLFENTNIQTLHQLYIRDELDRNEPWFHFYTHFCKSRGLYLFHSVGNNGEVLCK